MDIKMIRGTTHTLNFRLKDSTGANYVIPTNAVLRFGVKHKATDYDYVLKKELTSKNASENGDSYVLTITPEETQGLPFGRYCYDVGLQDGNNYYMVIPCSYFFLHHNITSKEG